MVIAVTRNARPGAGNGVVVDFGLTGAISDVGDTIDAVVTLQYTKDYVFGLPTASVIIGRAIGQMNPATAIGVSMAYTEAALLSAALTVAQTSVEEVLALYGS